MVVANSKVRVFTTDDRSKVPEQLCLALGESRSKQLMKFLQ